MLTEEKLIEYSNSLKNLRRGEMRRLLFRYRREGVNLHDLACALAHGDNEYRNGEAAHYILDMMNIDHPAAPYELAYIRAIGIGFTGFHANDLKKLKEGYDNDMVLFDTPYSEPVRLKTFNENGRFKMKYPDGKNNICYIVENGILYRQPFIKRLLNASPCLLAIIGLILFVIYRPFDYSKPMSAIYSLISMEISAFICQLFRVDLTDKSIYKSLKMSIIWMVVGIILALCAFTTFGNNAIVVIVWPFSIYWLITIKSRNDNSLASTDLEYLRKYGFGSIGDIVPKRFKRYVDVGDGWEYQDELGCLLMPVFILSIVMLGIIYLR